MKKRKTILVFLMLCPMLVFAQDRYFYLAWDINQPIGNRARVSDVSTRGVKLGYRVMLSPAFSMGLDITSAAFEQYHPTETIETSTGAFTTDYFHFVYALSAAISGQYNFALDDEERFVPYAGLGLGANNNEYVKYYNIYDERERRWGFLARPEIGMTVKFGQRRSIGAMAAIHYDFSTNGSDQFGYKNFSSAGFQVGLIFLDY